MVDLGQPGDHQGDEEPAFRCRAPPEQRRKPGGTPGGVGSPGGPREGPQVSDPGAWPDRGPTWPAFLERGAVLRITDADANNWLPWALRSALAHWRHRSSHTNGGTGDGPDGGRERVGGGAGPPDQPPPHDTARRRSATSRGREGGDNERRGEPTALQPANR